MSTYGGCPVRHCLHDGPLFWPPGRHPASNPTPHSAECMQKQDNTLFFVCFAVWACQSIDPESTHLHVSTSKLRNDSVVVRAPRTRACAPTPDSAAPVPVGLDISGRIQGRRLAAVRPSKSKYGGCPARHCPHDGPLFWPPGRHPDSKHQQTSSFKVLSPASAGWL